MLYVVNSSLAELTEVRRLDSLVFSEKWDISLVEYQTAWLHNKEIYRFIKEDDEIRGYYFAAPFPKEIYESILSGHMEERLALPYILKYEENTEVYLYIYALVVDITVENYKLYSKPLTQDLVEIIERLKVRNIEVKDFGFLAISNAGVRLAERMGLTFIEEFESEEKPNPQAFRSDPKHFKPHSLFLQPKSK